MTENTQNRYFSHYFNHDSRNRFLGFGFRTASDTDLHRDNHADQYHCSVVLRGSGVFLYNREQYTLTTESVYQRLPADLEWGSLKVSGDWLEFHITIGASTFESLKAINILETSSPVFRITPEDFLQPWMEEHLPSDPVDNIDDLYELYFNTQKLLRAIHKHNTRLHLNDLQERIKASLPILSYNFNMPLSLEETAQSMGLSYETYRKRFREIIGVSPLQYRLTAKFHFAQRLLSDGFSVSYVAEKTGYSDQFIFSKQFKKYTGQRPIDLKRGKPAMD